MDNKHIQAGQLWTASLAWKDAAEVYLIAGDLDKYRHCKKEQADLLLMRAKILKEIADGNNSPDYVWKAKISTSAVQLPISNTDQ